eukprot:scaffold106163_cov60-Phaeocystis_antarctica.AAC.1
MVSASSVASRLSTLASASAIASSCGPCGGLASDGSTPDEADCGSEEAGRGSWRRTARGERPSCRCATSLKRRSSCAIAARSCCASSASLTALSPAVAAGEVGARLGEPGS